MNIKKKVLDLLPYVIGAGIGFIALESGAVNDIADVVLANMDHVKPFIESTEVIGITIGSVYVAETQRDYFSAEAKYTQ
jgi:hypothetical protein